ncbi:MAG: enoyl-CoA hydratase/isomerase family protein, partial [Desulfobacterales bacterium]|nr:enoyl-CoA hydratase/isomerase family protein [Desulfobacterales bacterium]
MPYEFILMERKDRVGIITLNRPEQYNTFNSGLAQDLCKALLEMEMDGSVRVVVIKGSGKAFCTGIDVSEFQGKTLQEHREWIRLMERMIHIIAYMKKPVIASAHGYAVSNGAGL